MPLIRGPLWDQKNLPSHKYAGVESLVLQFETEPDAIPPLLPEPFEFQYLDFVKFVDSFKFIGVIYCTLNNNGF